MEIMAQSRNKVYFWSSVATPPPPPSPPPHPHSVCSVIASFFNVANEAQRVTLLSFFVGLICLFVLLSSALWPVVRGWKGVWSRAGSESSVAEKSLKLWDRADWDLAMVSTRKSHQGGNQQSPWGWLSRPDRNSTVCFWLLWTVKINPVGLVSGCC